MIALIVTAFYVAGIISAVHAAMTVRTAQGAVAWTVSLVSFPFVAVPAYLVLGRNKFEGMSAAFNERQDEIDEILDGFKGDLDPWVVPVNDSPSWHRAIRELTGFELTRGNDVELLINGEATFESILEGVRAAENYVLFQFYMFHDDGLGREVKEALKERARNGVRVFVLYDEIGSGGLPDSYVEDLREADVGRRLDHLHQYRILRDTARFLPHHRIVQRELRRCRGLRARPGRRTGSGRG